jgi:hypothetical protein
MILSAQENSGLKTDHRFKKWAKTLNPGEVDLTKKNGYSLTGRFLRWNESVSLNENTLMVCASENGSMKYHSYDYKLIDYQGNRITPEIRKELIEKHATDEQKANSINSILYSYACYAYYFWKIQEPKTEILDYII